MKMESNNLEHMLSTVASYDCKEPNLCPPRFLDSSRMW